MQERTLKKGYNFLLCTIAALSVSCVQGTGRRPVIRAPDNTATTGRYIVVLQDDLSTEDLFTVMNRAAELSDDVEVHHHTEKVAKTFTAKLSSAALEKVCKTYTLACISA